MKTFKKLSAKKIYSAGAAFLLTASVGSVCAEEGDMSQTHTQQRVRTEFNLQTPDSDFAQSRHREQKMVMNKNQNQYQYKDMSNFQKEQGSAGADVKKYQNKEKYSWQGSHNPGAMNRHSTMNRSMPGSNMSSSMNSRAMGGKR